MSRYIMMLYVVVVLILCSQHCTTSYHLLPVSSKLLTQKHSYTASLHQTTHNDIGNSRTALWDGEESVEIEKKIDPAATNWGREVVVTSNSVFGNILVTGLGHMEEDEFILTVLNNQVSTHTSCKHATSRC